VRILVLVQGHYGQRIVDAIKKYGPVEWEMYVHTFPMTLPGIIDDAEEYLPKELPQVDLIISLGEQTAVAQMIPDIVRMTGAKAVIAPADNRAWLPAGLAKQIQRKLETQGVAMVYPVPFCSLTEKDSQNEYVREFSRYFGRPEVNISLSDDRVKNVTVLKYAPCGSTQYVAAGLANVWIRDAVERSGLLHHQYPCLATMGIDQEFEDTLMHRGGLMTKLAVEKGLKEVH
jgi:hypothetical protein